MRAVVMGEYGGPEVLRLAEVPDPRPGPDEVLVDIVAAGVNFHDVYQRTGQYPVSFPFVAGIESAGVVSETGPRVSGVRVGDRVGWVNVPSGYAERAAVPVDRLVPIRDDISTEIAAAVLLQGMTAHYLTHAAYPVRPGDTVLLHAAAGGTGLLIIQLVKRLGGTVIGTASTHAKAALARAAGANEVIVYTETEVAPAVRKITNGSGVDVVFDGVGGPTINASLASLRERGMLVVFGQSGGPVPPLDVQQLNHAGSLYLTRPNLKHYVSTRDDLLARARDVLAWAADGSLKVRVGRTYPLAEAAQAHADLSERRSTGKLLLLP
jgi:NADPH:quinone reductase